MDGITIGRVEILPLSDGYLARTPGRFFPETPAADWQPYRQFLDADGQVRLNLGCFLLRADGRTVLVDSGLGPEIDPGEGEGGRLLDALAAADVPAEAVDLVLATHLHLDHIGWHAARRGDEYAPTFPRARYLIQRAEWEHWLQPRTEQTPHIDEEDEQFLARLLPPLERAGVLELVDGEYAATPSVRYLPTPGHTPGHACVLVDGGDERAVILGDVAHSPAQVGEPQWPVGADEDRALGIATRRALWEQIEWHGLRVAAGHFPPPGIGRFVRVEGRRWWQA